jgi:hypothetical protein
LPGSARKGLSLVVRPVRIAICVSGQLRGYQKALATWKSLLALADCEVFIHCWKNVGQSEPNPGRKHLPFEGDSFQAAYRAHCMDATAEHVRARYSKLFFALQSDAVASAAELRSAYGTEHVVIEDDRSPKFDGWTNSKKRKGEVGMISYCVFDPTCLLGRLVSAYAELQCALSQNPSF